MRYCFFTAENISSLGYLWSNVVNYQWRVANYCFSVPTENWVNWLVKHKQIRTESILFNHSIGKLVLIMFLCIYFCAFYLFKFWWKIWNLLLFSNLHGWIVLRRQQNNNCRNDTCRILFGNGSLQVKEWWNEWQKSKLMIND